MNLEANLHSLLSFAWTLTRPTKFNLLRQNIVFSYSQRVSVSFSWLIDYFSFFFCYFTLLLIFTKIILLWLFYYIFFHENYFYYFMFRDVPGCSGMFRVPGFIDGQSNVSRSWYIKQCIPLGIHRSTWSKHGGKWRDRRREKHRQVLPVFFFVNEHNNSNAKTKPQTKKQPFLKSSQKRNSS